MNGGAAGAGQHRKPSGLGHSVVTSTFGLTQRPAISTFRVLKTSRHIPLGVLYELPHYSGLRVLVQETSPSPE